MQEEARLIVQAIESLKSEASIFKDYIFPIASALFSSLFGALIAYLFFKYQEYIKIEKEKMDAANRWILLAEEARSNLISIKHNYYESLTDNPIQRALEIPAILFTKQSIVENYSNLSFLAPKSIDKQDPKWGQVPLIRAMMHNYNYLQDLWLKRNEIDREIKEALVVKYSKLSFASVTIEEVIDCVGSAKLSILIDLTEHAIRLTDDLLNELNDFIIDFPKLCKSLIDTKLLKNYGRVITFAEDNSPKVQKLLQPIPPANYVIVEGLFGLDAEQIRICCAAAATYLVVERAQATLYRN